MSRYVGAAVATLLELLAPVAGLAEDLAWSPLPVFKELVIGVVDGDTGDVLVSPETARPRLPAAQVPQGHSPPPRHRAQWQRAWPTAGPGFAPGCVFEPHGKPR
jgi:hypothetical protein